MCVCVCVWVCVCMRCYENLTAHTYVREKKEDYKMNKLPIIVPYIYDARYHAHPYILVLSDILLTTNTKGLYTDELSRSPDEGQELEVVQSPHSVATGRLHPIHSLNLSHQIQISEEESPVCVRREWLS